MSNTISKVIHNGTEFEFESVNGGVTSVNGQTGDVIVDSSNTKTFYLSNTSDLTNAQAALDWYLAGKNPIIRLGSYTYVLYTTSSTTKILFRRTQINSETAASNSYSVNNIYYITINYSSGTVTSVTTDKTTEGSYLATGTDYSTPYTPLYNGSPATKKYVDDKQSAISVTLTTAGWSNNTQSVTATGVTASNTVIVSPAPTSISDYTDSKIYCSAQASNSLTFTCEAVPSNAITVNIVILN